jgi:kynureninase
MAALDCGLKVFEAAAPLGGMIALRAKSLALTDLFIELVEQTCSGHGLTLVTPRNHHERGSQVCLSRKTGSYAIIQALINRGVIGDFRAGDGGLHQDILRFGFTPLYTRFEDVWLAADHLRQVLESGEWTQARHSQRQNVT